MKNARSKNLSSLKATEQYRLIRQALAFRQTVSGGSAAGRSGGFYSEHWESLKQEGFEVEFKAQCFQLQAVLEKHRETSRQRVIMFCRRSDPPSSAPASNTQRGTFNSMHRDENGFFQRLQILKKHPEQKRALAALLPSSGPYPRWNGGWIRLGDASAEALVQRFLKATAVIEEIKGTPAAALAERFPPELMFSAKDIAAATFAEGKRRQVSRVVRERSAKLRELAVAYFQKQSHDGSLRCFVDHWAPPIPVRGNIVEIHHDNELAGYPEDGKALTFAEAIKFLFPLCPNCHRLLPSKPGGGRYTIPELRALLHRRNRTK